MIVKAKSSNNRLSIRNGVSSLTLGAENENETITLKDILNIIVSGGAITIEKHEVTGEITTHNYIAPKKTEDISKEA